MAASAKAGPQAYEFLVAGELGGDWYDWLDGFQIQPRDGVTAIRGTVVDQPALYGIIARFAGLGVTLLAVNRRGPAPESSRE